MTPSPLYLCTPIKKVVIYLTFSCYVTDVHAWFIHVFCERAAAGQTPPTTPGSQVTDRRKATQGAAFSVKLYLNVTVHQVSGERARGQHHRHCMADRGEA